MQKTHLSIWRQFVNALPLTLLAMLLAGTAGVLAGTHLDSPAGPGSTSSYSLNDIFERLDSGTAGTQSTFTEPAVPPGTATMHSLNDIMAAAPAQDDAAGAVAANVLTGKTFWGLTNGAWGPQTGSMPLGNNLTGIDGEISFAIPDGYYAGKTATAQDGDLKGENILPGVNIFGVDGSIPSQSDVAGGEGELSFNIPDGYYAGKTATAQDSDLKGENILPGVNIFGVDGSIPSQSDVTGADGELSFNIPDGYYAGKTATAADGDLKGENILPGVNIFGVDGSMPSQSDVTGADGELSFDIPDGYYAGKTATAADGDLQAGNILQTANIFGVAGTIQVRNNLTGADGELSFSIPNGYYAGKTVTATDANLVAENIAYGITIFGVTGTFGARFINHLDGTVTDTFTTLMWQQNAHGGTDKTWNAAVTFCEDSVTGGYADWRLPTEDEVADLTTGEQRVSAGEPREFSNIAAASYWTGTSDFFLGTTYYSYIHMGSLSISQIDNDALLFHPWCVRDN